MLSARHSARSLTLLQRMYSAEAVTPPPRRVPWFLDRPPSSEVEDPTTSPSALRASQPPPPANLPSHLRSLHEALSALPYLEPATLTIRPPLPTAYGPPLPHREPQGRRKRGGTDSGRGIHNISGVPDTGDVWNWIVLAQVKEGTEDRGAIEHVVRALRTTLLKAGCSTLPLHSKKRMGGGWAMIDCGDFAVHILSRESREKFFGDVDGEKREWE